MTDFAKKLLQWNADSNTRQMPWKCEKDPYKIWLSEVILQQTRVEQGWSYYEKFIEKFSTIFDLANAQDKDVFKLWEGLGYYNRCKNLLYSARFICKNLNGKFPEKFEDILALKGVGSYTASAVCSFAYNQTYAVVDGNVFRVLSRVYGISTPIDSAEGKTFFIDLAQKNLAQKQSASYNQAIMDFGATVCKPATPLCSGCVMKNICAAYIEGKTNLLPVKEKTLSKKLRYFSWFVLKVKNEIFLHQRLGKDIWQNLFEFYLLETEGKNIWNEENINEFIQNQFGEKPVSINISEEYSQQLTHQKIKAVFVKIGLKQKPVALKNQLWTDKKNVPNFAFPKIIKTYLEKYF